MLMFMAHTQEIIFTPAFNSFFFVRPEGLGLLICCQHSLPPASVYGPSGHLQSTYAEKISGRKTI
jgi:hypothetical protein